MKLVKSKTPEQLLSDEEKVIQFLNNKNTLVAVQIAPAVRVAIGEEFGFPIGTNVVGKLVSGLKQAGFNYVYDVCAGADFTIIEESKELARRFRQNTNLPVLTSCCPVWIKYLEYAYEDLAKNASTCKSPTEMLSTLIKHFSPNIKVVSVTPCVGKKLERTRDNNIDVSLTTRELASILKQRGVNIADCVDENFDELFGVSSGAGLIFGVTGGVTEAVLRTTVHILNNHLNSILEVKTNNSLTDEEFAINTIRTNEGIRECEINTAEGVLKIAIVNGISNAKKVLEEIKAGKEYHLVEVMNCQGGCINGPGQPYVDHSKISNDELVRLRGGGLYALDHTNKIKTSHANENILAVYKQLGEKNMEHLLHLSFKNSI